MSLRSPGSFGLDSFNDHEGYGVVEVLQNLVLDFKEAAGNYKEQWAVCEALALLLADSDNWIVTQYGPSPVYVSNFPTQPNPPPLVPNRLTPHRIDDGDGVNALFELLGRMFMSILAQLERAGLLSADSELKSLGWAMGLFLETAHASRAYGLLEDPDEETLGPAKDGKAWQPQFFENQILAYAQKYKIALAGPSKLEALIAETDADVDLPDEASNTGNADPFRFAKGLEEYISQNGTVDAVIGGRPLSEPRIGGDRLDITTWTPSERKKASYNNKDPLGRKEIEAIKKGMVMQLA